MIRSHFVVMGRSPSESSLATLKDGYQLFQETRTGLFYLSAHSKPLGRRPDFSGFLEREITHRIDVSDLKRFMSARNSGLDIRDHEVSINLIQRTASLSKQLNMPVFAAEITDDEYGMAVLVNEGSLRYARFRTSQRSQAGGETRVEVTYTPEAGFTSDREPANEIFGLAQTALRDVFQAGGIDLHNYAAGKPSREEIGTHANGPRSPAKAYLDGFGVFKRLGYARPRVTFIDRMIVPCRYVVSSFLLPFILVGMTTFVLINSGSPKADSNPGSWRLFCIGLAVLAIPILFLIWVIRGTIGA